MIRSLSWSLLHFVLYIYKPKLLSLAWSMRIGLNLSTASRANASLMLLCFSVQLKYFRSLMHMDTESKPLILQAVDFPGGKVSFVAEMNFLPDSMKERINCYRVLDDDGRTISGSRFQEVRCSPPHLRNSLQTCWEGHLF